MAQDATLPEVVVALPDGAEPDPEFSHEPPPRGRHAARAVNAGPKTDTHTSAWPSIVYYMALGAAGCLLVLSGNFAFNTSVSVMDATGIKITCIAGAIVLALLVSALSCLRNRCMRCVWESAGVIVVITANWVGWFYHFNLPREIMQLFS